MIKAILTCDVGSPTRNEDLDHLQCELRILKGHSPVQGRVSCGRIHTINVDPSDSKQ